MHKECPYVLNTSFFCPCQYLYLKLLSLIFTDKKSTPECSPANSPFLKSRSPKISSADSSLVINGTTAIKEDAEIPGNNPFFSF